MVPSYYMDIDKHENSNISNILYHMIRSIHIRPISFRMQDNSGEFPLIYLLAPYSYGTNIFGSQRSTVAC